MTGRITVDIARDAALGAGLCLGATTGTVLL